MKAGRRNRVLFHFAFVAVACAFPCADPWNAAAEPKTITRLKDLHLATALVEKGKGQAVLVVPKGGRYREASDVVREKVRRLTGFDLPVHEDTDVPEDLLSRSNVIAFGNMATNAFIEKLYRQWYVILDLKYPGADGYVVRSLHDPYGTGRNVIFLGGSDDGGVAEAARVFAAELEGAESLKVGWLMKIRLGKGLVPPEIGEQVPNWIVYSWRDSWRDSNPYTEKPSTLYGWNPISIAGVLYYMTGKPEYLDYFKKMAIPDPKDVPRPNRASEAFNDPMNPLVKNSHYQAHLLDCVYDMIEESPLFSEKERLFLTNKLMEHQIEYDPKHEYSSPNGPRHNLYHMLCIYTGSRYFAKYYPDAIWNKRIENVRRGFHSFLADPTWAEKDYLRWVSTSIEPVLEFFLFDGSDAFVESGTARQMMSALEILMTGEQLDDYNHDVTISLLHKAAYLLKDSRYVWMVRQLGFNFSAFRIGQSYWPPDDLPVEPPGDISNRILVYPLVRKDRMESGTPVSQEEAFQILAYRSGLSKTDDYLLLDGFNGLGRHNYQLNTLNRLRMFHGINILNGDGNDLSIWRDGMVGEKVPRSAALREKFAGRGLVFLQSEVPDMPSSGWQRFILYRKDLEALVIDKVTSRETGHFDVVCTWQFHEKVKPDPAPKRRVQSGNGAVISATRNVLETAADNMVEERFSLLMQKDDSFAFVNLLHSNRYPKAITEVGPGAYLITGSHTAYAGLGDHSLGPVSAKATFIYFDRNRVFLVGATQLTLRGVSVFQSTVPLTLLWDLDERKATVVVSRSATVTLGDGVGAVREVLPSGEHLLDGPVARETSALIATALSSLDAIALAREKAAREEIPQRPASDWTPRWTVELGGAPTVISAGDSWKGGPVWVASRSNRSGVISRVSKAGSIEMAIPVDNEVLSLWSPKTKRQSDAFGILAGFRNDFLRAYSDAGRELWSFKAQLHPSLIIGDRYDAPWFTDPGPRFRMSGIYSILVADIWGKGREEIAVGRPCTVEFHALDGTFLGRAPTRWGNNTSLAVLKNNVSAGGSHMVLAGKAYTGNPFVSVIIDGYRNISDWLFSELPSDTVNMTAWLQRGMNHMAVADLRNDGTEDLVYILNGHWNELRVYDGRSGNPLWVRFFGPDKGRRTFMAGMAFADLRGDGIKTIVVGTKLGWLCAFDPYGKPLWQRRVGNAVTSLTAIGRGRKLAVGCGDGGLLLLDGEGRILRRADLGAPVAVLASSDGDLYAGASNGTLRKYSAE